MRRRRSVLVLVAISVFLLALPAFGESPARVTVGSQQVSWEPQIAHDHTVLTVSTPGGKVLRQEFKGTQPVFDIARAGAADGVYHWELQILPPADRDRRQTVDAAAQERAGSAVRGVVASGTFAVRDGSILPADATEPRRQPAQTAAPAQPPVSMLDQVIADDLIVQGSACVGLDCVNNESFGFDTIRLKENNTRIKFDDTSTGTGFPNHDWQLTANDSASGGANKFSIEDITAATVPFTVTGSAPTNSIFVDSTGRLGLRTSTPVLDIHVSTTNTPAMRLEQTSGGGFTAQTWDIGGNEANFFVRDVTGGSRLPFRIRPGAPTSSIDISASGNVGIGTASPSVKLDVESTGATSTDGKTLIRNSSGTSLARELLELQNNGGAIQIFKDTTQTTRWSFGTFSTSFVVDNQANGGVEMLIGNTGNVTIAGTLTQNSDRTTKRDITAVDPQSILTKVAALPIATWNYKGDEERVTHLGPMAQDFAAAFGLGADDRHIAPIDLAGVSLAAVQALNERLTEKDQAIAKLQQENADLAKRLAAIESAVQALSGTAHP